MINSVSATCEGSKSLSCVEPGSRPPVVHSSSLEIFLRKSSFSGKELNEEISKKMSKFAEYTDKEEKATACFKNSVSS
ncbi:MAG: hypothetical protein V4489_05110 [Chlamydiota bacterium]